MSITSHTGLCTIIKEKYGKSTIVSVRHYIKSSESLTKFNFLYKSQKIQSDTEKFESVSFG